MNVTLYDIGLRFVGMKEVPGQASNPAILAMLKLDQDWPTGDEVPWCSGALNYWAWLLRLPRSKSLSARSWLGVGTPVNYNTASAAYDVCVFWRGASDDGTTGHVGLFAGREPGRVLVLGGNQGDSVSIAPFPTERLLGVRRLRVHNRDFDEFES